MDETLDRRQFLGATAAVSTLSPASVGPRAGAGAVRHFFLVENGTPNTQGYHVSMLSAQHVTRHLAALTAIRRRTNYLQDLTYSSTDRWKVPYVRQAVAYVAATPDLTGHTVRVETFTNWHQKSPDVRRDLYFGIYHRLFETTGTGSSPRAAVHLLARSTDDRDHRLAADLKAHLGPGTQVTLGGGRYKELTALASVVFGTIKTELDLKGVDTGVSKVKLEIRDILRSAVRVPNLGLEQLAHSGKFAVATLAL